MITTQVKQQGNIGHDNGGQDSIKDTLKPVKKLKIILEWSKYDDIHMKQVTFQ